MAPDAANQDAVDLAVVNARLRGREGTWSIGVRGDRIVAIAPSPPDAAVVVDADGSLVTESFVNAHLHLDKVHTLDRVGEAALAAYRSGSMGGAMSGIELAASVKSEYDESWIEANARAVLLDGVRHGVRHVLAFADVDPVARLAGVQPLLRLREEFRGVIDLQVVAFPQDGLLRAPGTEALVEQAVLLGADAVGGIPWIEYTEDDQREHVRRMCALAAAHGRRVAMLVDDAGDPSLRTTQMLASALIAHGLVGRGVANHARALALLAEPSLLRIAALARRAGLGFVSDPHTGPLHLPVAFLRSRGVTVALGQDDVEDAYYPFGQHNLLEVAFLATHLVEGMLDTKGCEAALDMVTTAAASVLGVDGHRLEVGGNADLVVHTDPTVRAVISRHAAPRVVVASGRVVARTTEATTFADDIGTGTGTV